MCEIVGFEGEIVHDLTKPDGTPRKLLDIDRIRGLGWSPSIPLNDGLRASLEWFLTERAQGSVP